MNPMLAKIPTERRYLIFQCPRCQHREWAKEGSRVGFCKVGKKPVPLIDNGESLHKSGLCPDFVLDAKMERLRKAKVKTHE